MGSVRIIKNCVIGVNNIKSVLSSGSINEYRKSTSLKKLGGYISLRLMKNYTLRLVSKFKFKCYLFKHGRLNALIILNNVNSIDLTLNIRFI